MGVAVLALVDDSRLIEVVAVNVVRVQQLLPHLRVYDGKQVEGIHGSICPVVVLNRDVDGVVLSVGRSGSAERDPAAGPSLRNGDT
jgi:hypothetical protein